jgi:hypothetical protein
MEPWRLIGLLALAGGALAGQQQPPPAPRGTIAVGDTVRDSLTRRDAVLPAEHTYAQEWRLAGRSGEAVTIDLAADEFDAYAYLLGPGLDAAPPQDDDSGGRCNARLTVRLPQNGDYFIVVTSSEPYATGAFTLSVVAGPKPAALAPCTR